METIRNLGIGAGIILVLTLSVPLLLIASKGLKKERDQRDKKKERSIFTRLIFIILSFFVLPSILFLAYNFVASVLIGKMPIEDFKAGLWGYSFQPVITFYSDLVTSIRSFLHNIFTVE